ncbi:hypothetical protein [Nonomuraea sp. NPDC050202]|uniref:hypothetical protein n=1 Tax=Nonomuraea sp. NPDC050202 TaxID=3155035 RepID=UPI0033D0AAF9
MATATTEKPIKPITVNGITGNEPAPDDHAKYLVWKVVHRHNTAVPLALEEEQAWNGYISAEAATEQAWQALDTTHTTDWAAAHHRWVKAEQALDTAVRRWESAAAALEQAFDDAHWGDRTYEFYEEVTRQAGIRELLCANRPTSPWQTLDVERRRREREQLAGKTLQHLPA